MIKKTVYSIIITALTVSMGLSNQILEKFDAELVKLRTNRDGILRMIEMGKERIKKNIRVYETSWQISVAYFYLGTFFEKESGKKSEAFYQGIQFAESAVKINKDGIDGQFWLGVSYGLWSAENGVLTSLFYSGSVKEKMDFVIQKNPSFFMGLPWALRSKYYFYLPAIFGGDKKKAYEDMEMAMKYGSKYRTIYEFYAEMLVADSRYREAKEMVLKGLKLPFSKAIDFEERVSIEKLSNFLKTIESKMN